MGFLIKCESKIAAALHQCFLNGWPGLVKIPVHIQINGITPAISQNYV